VSKLIALIPLESGRSRQLPESNGERTVAGIKIAKALKLKLPAEQRVGLEDHLWDLSGGACHLCGEPMNRSADLIEADHDIPEDQGGETTIENLKLAHKSCNAAKRHHPTVNIRPYLRLNAFIQKTSVAGPVRYGECAQHFGITPQPVHMTRVGKNKVKFELPDGSTVESPVYKQGNAAGSFEHCYINAPRAAIFNDEDCQPRNVKVSQAWAIYNDLQKNPLHEPPGCRLEQIGNEKYKLLMFDGQHKTVASWMSDYDHIVVKVYLNLTVQQATALVNSIQAKIKKLPLSPFEVAAKLGDEWEHKWALYEEEVATENASEAGFIRWLTPGDRSRGQQAFREGRLRQLLDREDLLLLQYVKRQSSEEGVIPEATFKSKVLAELVYSKPLTEAGEVGEQKRTREADNIVRVLNHFTAKVFEPAEGTDTLTTEQEETKRRLVYQGALKFISDMLRRILNNFCTTDTGLEFIEANIDDEKWAKISASIERLVNHPIWHQDFEVSPKARAVREALLKNQQVKETLKDVGLTPGYILGAEPLSGNWYK
jgi:hypothetical protein